jgi:hypothetical protein
LKTDHHHDFRNDYCMAAWEAARATSPRRLTCPRHAGDDYLFLDGGVWANNPVMAAIVEALSVYDVSRDSTSRSSPSEPATRLTEISRFGRERRVFPVARDHLKRAMFLTTDNAHAQATLLLGPENILRLEPTGKAAGIDLADWQAAKAQLPQLAQADFDLNGERIVAFFADKTAPRQRFYT